MISLVIRRGVGTNKGLCFQTTHVLGKEKKNTELKWTVVRKGKERLKNQNSQWLNGT